MLTWRNNGNMLESSYAIYGSNKYTQTLPLQIYSAWLNL
jgi:hypothetical protein